SIDKLLNAVAELMKKEPALDRQAFDHLRQLQTRLRFAGQATHATRATNLNIDSPPRKWLERIDKKEGPIDFIRREYSQLMQQGFSRIQLKKSDSSLYNVLCKWLTIHKELPPDVRLPTQAELLEQKLAAVGELKALSRKDLSAGLRPADIERLRL